MGYILNRLTPSATVSNGYTCCYFDGVYLWAGDAYGQLRVLSYNGATGVYTVIAGPTQIGTGGYQNLCITGDGTYIYVSNTTN